MGVELKVGKDGVHSQPLAMVRILRAINLLVDDGEIHTYGGYKIESLCNGKA